MKFLSDTTKMERETTVKITNVKQFECLVQLMEKNVDVAKGFFSFGSSKPEYNKAWESFADKLNSLGPPIREGTGWQKVWNDFKGKIKKKLGENKKEITGTGGGPCRLKTFSPFEETVISLLGYEKIFDKTNSKTFGLPSAGANSSTTVKNNVGTAISSNNVSPLPVEMIEANDVEVIEGTDHNKENIATTSGFPTRTRNKIKNTQNVERQHLLEIQTKSMQEIERNSKECARYSRKSYELQEKKFKLWRDFQLDKKKYLKSNMELKLRTIKYKERKLELQENQYA